MTKFIVKGRVKYNGKLYATGETVEVEKKDVAEFKKYGWQVVGGKEPEGQQGQQGGEGGVDYSKMNKAQIVEELQKLGVEFDKNAKKDDLLALLVK